jgi:DNA polymerase III epsilon subunit-like protein
MPKIIVFDTETEGLNPYTDTIKELAWQVYSTDGELLKECNFVGEIKKNAVPEFIKDAQEAEYFVGHNVEFDIKFMSIHLPKELITKIRKGKKCTMLDSAEIVGIKNFAGYKNPKLTEIYSHFFGEEFENQHTALADTRACARVFFELLDREVIKLG